MPTLCTTQHPQDNQEVEAILYWVDELRETILIRMEAYCCQAMTYYNKRSKQLLLQPDDLVLRRMFENMVEPKVGKF